MLRAKRKTTSPYVHPLKARGTRPASSNATVSMPSVLTASSVTATQTGPTNVPSSSCHAVALGSAPSFDPAANVVSILALERCLRICTCSCLWDFIKFCFLVIYIQPTCKSKRRISIDVRNANACQ